MHIVRTTKQNIKKTIQANKVIVLHGPRRVGKTTVLKELQEELANIYTIQFLNGEDAATQKALSSQNVEQLKAVVGDTTLLIVDEAQHVPNIGLHLKLLVDHIPGLAIIASGSASFTLAQQVGEPLTGRKKTMHMYSVSAQEMITTVDVLYQQSTLEERIVYGAYPELFQLSSKQERQEYLHEIVSSYLFRDILALENIRNPKKMRDLLQLLAFQIGQEVSLSELGNALELNSATVYRYLDLLEQSFVIVNVRGFSRNLRKEVTKTSRYYFTDNGIRNALINNFNDLSLRNDVGQLWENYVVMERIKRQEYFGPRSNNYFWRTYDQKEVDWVEERDGHLYGYEIKWNPRKTVKAPKLWLNTYDNASWELIHPENYLSFLTATIKDA
jgi:hypothetical protein